MSNSVTLIFMCVPKVSALYNKQDCPKHTAASALRIFTIKRINKPRRKPANGALSWKPGSEAGCFHRYVGCLWLQTQERTTTTKKKTTRKETVTRWTVECCHFPRAPSQAEVKQKLLHKVTLSIETVAEGISCRRWSLR